MSTKMTNNLTFLVRISQTSKNGNDNWARFFLIIELLVNFNVWFLLTDEGVIPETSCFLLL